MLPETPKCISVWYLCSEKYSGRDGNHIQEIQPRYWMEMAAGGYVLQSSKLFEVETAMLEKVAKCCVDGTCEKKRNYSICEKFSQVFGAMQRWIA